MGDYKLTMEQIVDFGRYLQSEERSAGTIEKYLRDARFFKAWLDGRPVTKEAAAAWRSFLLAENYAPVTINSMLASLNALFRFVGWEDCRVKFLKIQKRLFREESKELTQAEYERLLKEARSSGQERLALLMETICATGIRVSEVRYITVESARKGHTRISLKGKIRTILLPAKLCRKLLKYARAKKITAGEIFLTASGKSLSRKQIWVEMKRLCRRANVEPNKVFPHNLRHLFARMFYKVSHDLPKLADVLGHSCIETTRIYLLSTGTEHREQLNRLGLVL